MNYHGVRELAGQPFVSRQFVLGYVAAGTVNAWQYLKRVTRKSIEGETWYEYESLPRSARAKLPFSDKSAVLDAAKLTAHNRQQVEVAAEQASLAYDLAQAREGWVPYFDTYAAAYDNERAGDYARAHAVFVRLVELSVADASPRYTHAQLYPHFRALRLPGYCTDSLAYFSRQLRTCAKDGVTALLLHGNLGNKFAEKATAFHEYRSEAYYSLPYKYSFGTVAELVSYECEANDLRTVSESWIKQYLSQPSVKNRLIKLRHGVKEYTNRVQPYLERTTALHANDLWQMDGSPLQFFCWNADRTKKIRLTLFVILDVHSRKIVGYDMSLSEDRFSAINALSRAIQLTGMAPYELVNDHFSGGKSEEYRRIQDELTSRGVVFRLAKVGNPQDKAQIERWFGSFQTRFCKHLAGYFGEGVMTRRLDGKANPDFLKHQYEVTGLPNLDTMLARMVDLIDRYNGTALPGESQSPNQRYHSSEKPNARPLKDYQRALLFWPAKTVQVRNCKVKLTVQKREYVYEVEDPALALELNGTAVEVRYDLQELADPTHKVMLFQPGGSEPICELRLVTRVHQALANQSQADLTGMQQHGKKKAAIEREADRQTAEKIAAGVAVVGADGALAFIDPRTAAKYDRNDAETDYYQEQFGIDERLVAEEPAEPVAVRNNPYFGQHGAGLSLQDHYVGRLRREGDGTVWKPRERDDDD